MIMLLVKKDIEKMIENGLLVKNLIDKKMQIQQCGVDLTVAKVFSFQGDGCLDFSNERRRLPEYVEIEPEKDGDEEYWILEPGTYHIAINEIINLPNDIAALLLPRSSALTCGIVQHSALWDPGYHGRSFFHVDVTRRVKIYKNARIGQMVFFKLPEETEAYNGIFKGEDVTRNAKRGK